MTGKIGTANNSVDNWFVSIDGKQIVITWLARDNNKTKKLYSASSAMQIYRKYLEYQHPTRLVSKPFKNTKMFYIDKLGKLFCDKSNKHNKIMPKWSVKNKKCVSSKESEYNSEKNNKNILFWFKHFFKIKKHY